MECPYCNAENRDGVHFCSNCGKPLTPTITASSTSTGSANTNSRTLTPGSRLQGGRYIIKKMLGQGGMGAAMLATDIRLDSKSVVLKELISDNTDPARLQEDVRNFKSEVATLAHLDHPLIPNVTDHFQEGSRYFMVQEYAEGENLEERMDRVNQPMKEREALGYASAVLDILDYLAQETPPIVHRDIKPANIIIGAKDKRAHLVDFGIARADEAKNAKRKQTSALGTPGYAPPEQYQGNADGRSDIYALAATLHHVLTNRDPREYPPFAYPPARTLNSQLTYDIERVLEHALQINVGNRYQSAAEMKRDIDEILATHFGSTGDTSTYILGAWGPMTAPRPQPNPRTPIPPSAPAPINRPRPAQPSAPYGAQRQVGAPAPYPPSQPGAYGRPPAQQKQRGGNYLVFSFLLLIVVVGIIAAAFFVLPRLNGSNTGGSGNATPAPSTPVATIPTSGNGIGVTTVNGETIGISEGSAAFDTSRSDDGSLKIQAATAFASGDIGTAQSLWHSANSKATNDAEPLIYLENQRVKTSGVPYITLIVGTMLTGSGDRVQVGRDNLQGAYIAQKE